MEPRKQFTFYESFYRALQRIRDKQDRATAYDMICEYALFQINPDLDNVPDSIAIAFELLHPVLDTARKKAENGKEGGKANGKQNESKPEAKPKQTKSKKKTKNKQPESEKEVEKEEDIENDIEVDVDVESKPDTAGERQLLPMGGQLGKGVVFLTQEQHDSLLNKMGLDAYEHYTNKLSDFIIKNDAKVKNHYETILKWWREDSRVEP